MDAWAAAGLPVARTELVGPDRLAGRRILDIRQDAEFAAGHVPGAEHVELGSLAAVADQLESGPTVVMCGHGERAAGAASLLERAGHRDLAVLVGGPEDWARSTGREPGVGVMTTGTSAPIRLGLRANAAQFALLVAVNALVGGMVGQQQTVLPLLAERRVRPDRLHVHLHLRRRLRDHEGGRPTGSPARSRTATAASPCCWSGWLFAVPVPADADLAPNWGWVVAANVLLGINQGLTWSTTVVMKIDLVGPRQRGLAMGLNEAAGYGAVAVTSLVAGYLAEHFGLRPAPFLLGLAYTALALLLSGVFIRETRGHAHLEAGQHTPRADGHPRPPARRPHRPADLAPDQPDRARAVLGQPGRAGQQPELRPVLGPVPAAVRHRRPAGRPDRPALRPLPRGVGRRPADHRRPVRPDRAQAPDHRRHDHPGRRAGGHRRLRRLRRLGRRHRAARRRHRDGLPHPARRRRRRRAPGLARPGRGRLPGLARPRLRRRRRPRRDRGRPRGPARRRLGRRRRQRRLRRRRRRPDVRDPPTPGDRPGRPTPVG